jgi:hypothetical protein
MEAVAISTLSNDQVRSEAAKILAARAKQKERMKIRNKSKREREKALLAVAEEKGLLPKIAKK